jgi:hypothetical protein
MDDILADTSLVQASSNRIVSRTSASSLLQLPSTNKCQTKRRQHHQSNTTDSSSSETIIRRATSWRWIIVFGSFCIHFVADGVLFSFGILMHTIKDDLNIELPIISIIASLFVSLPLLLAPISSALVNKIGCRPTTMLGGLICSIGLLVAALSGNFIGALIGIGVMCGKDMFYFCFRRFNRNDLLCSTRCWTFVCICTSRCDCCTLFR